MTTKEAEMDAMRLRAALHGQGESEAVLYQLRARARKWMEVHTWRAVGKGRTLAPGLVSRLVLLCTAGQKGEWQLAADMHMVRGVLLMMAGAGLVGGMGV